MDTYKTKVIFRKFKDGDVIAIFPEEPGTNNPYDCMSYQHIGQHGVCDPLFIISITKLATQAEYADLFMELDLLGYNLQVCKRYTYQMLYKKNAELQRQNDEADRLYAEQESNYMNAIGG